MDIALLDPAIVASLPPGSEVTGVVLHEVSDWTRCFTIDSVVAGQRKKYFLKILSRPEHVEMARGEYESQVALAEHIPDNVILPLAHGTCQRSSSESFFLAPFHNLVAKIPRPEQLAAILHTLYQSSQSPDGKFGFHVPTFNGIVPVINDWCDTWEEWFTRQLKSDIRWEQSIRGPDAVLDEIADDFFGKVVPRLLRPLETGGRSIKPTLLHGDLWQGNCQVDEESQQMVLFDSCCCYGHGEMELYMMTSTRYQLSEGHINAYKSAIGPSEPVEDFDDRIALYAIRDKIINSGLHEKKGFLREETKQEMLRLLAKYPGGLSGFDDKL